MGTLAFLLLIRWFLILLVNHSSAVDPVSKFFPGDFLTASAIMGLSSTKARRTIEFPGRVKKTTDKRTESPCVPGGGLPM